MPTLYADFLSQPCRAIEMFCRIAGIEHDVEVLSLAKREHKSEDYINNVHKFGQVPAWKEDDGTVFTESASILRFLANQYGNTDLWPEDLIQRQKVDCGLDFNACQVRPNLLPMIIAIIGPKFFGMPEFEAKQVEERREQMNLAFDKITTLLGDKDFIAGDSLSLADLQIFCEVAENKVMAQADMSKYEKLEAWFNRVYENEHVKAIHDQFVETVQAALG